MTTRKLVLAVVAVVTAVLAPGTAASADEALLATCPDGYSGVVVGVTTEKTGYREVLVCFKNPPPATAE